MKTTLIKTDFAIQVALVIIDLALLMISFLANEVFFFLMCMQFMVGAYQMMSSMVGLFVNQNTFYYAYRKQHFFGSLLYLVFMCGVFALDVVRLDGSTLSMVMALIIIVVVPQLIMCAYFYLSYIIMKEEKTITEKSSILF